MKNKRLAFIALMAGLAILATSAFADYLAGSGYNSLKDAVKETTAQLADTVQSFTAETNVTLKVNGEAACEYNSIFKVNNEDGKTETRETTKGIDGERWDFYSYVDSQKRVYSHGEGYYVHEGKFMSPYEVMQNPFEEEITGDLERIMDAFVGNLKDLVMTEEKDGKKMYAGSLSQAQVPALANAVISFVVKQSTGERHYTEQMAIPQLKSDIYVTDVYGKAIQREDGIIESVIGSASLSGRDKDGREHVLSAELTVNISGINSTIVTEPDLRSENVEYIESRTESLEGKFAGTYKAAVVGTVDGAYVHAGDRVLDIYSVSGNEIKGRFYEEYLEGYGPEKPFDIEFTAVGTDRYNIRFSYTDADGAQKLGTIQFFDNGADGAPEAHVGLDATFYDDDYSARSYEIGYQLKRVFE